MAGLSASDVLLGFDTTHDNPLYEHDCIINVDIMTLDKSLNNLKEIANSCVDFDLDIAYTNAFVNLTKMLHNALKVLQNDESASTVNMNSVARGSDPKETSQDIPLFSSRAAITMYTSDSIDLKATATLVIDKCFDILNAMMDAKNGVRDHLFVNAQLKKKKAQEALAKIQREVEAQRKAKESAALLEQARQNVERIRKELEAQQKVDAKFQTLQKWNNVKLQDIVNFQELVKGISNADSTLLDKYRNGANTMLNLKHALDEAADVNEIHTINAMISRLKSLPNVNQDGMSTYMDTSRQQMIRALETQMRDLETQAQKRQEALHQLKRAEDEMATYVTDMASDDENVIDSLPLHEQMKRLDIINADINKIDANMLDEAGQSQLSKLREQVDEQWKQYNTRDRNYIDRIRSQTKQFNDDLKKTKDIGELKKLKALIGATIKDAEDQIPGNNSINPLKLIVEKIDNEVKKAEAKAHPYYEEKKTFEEELNNLNAQTTMNENLKAILQSFYKKEIDFWDSKTQKTVKDDMHFKNQKKIMNAIKMQYANITGDSFNRFLKKYYEEYKPAIKTGKDIAKKKANLINDANSFGGPDVADMLISILDNTGYDRTSELINNIKKMYTTANVFDAANPLTYPYIVKAHNKAQSDATKYKSLQTDKYDVQTFVKNLMDENKLDAVYIRGFNEMLELHKSIYSNIQKIKQWMKDEKNIDLDSKLLKLDDANLQIFINQLMQQFSGVNPDNNNRIHDEGNVTSILKRTTYPSVFNDPLNFSSDHLGVLSALNKELDRIVTKLYTPNTGKPASTVVTRGRKMGGASSTSFVPIANTLAISLAVLAVSVYVSEVVKKKYADRGVMRSGLYSMASFASAYAVLMIPLAFALQTAIAVDIVWKHLQMMYIFFAILLSLAYLVPTHVHHWLSAGAMAISWVVSIFLAMLVAAL